MKSEEFVLSDTAKRLLPWVVAVGFFMESLDTTILNTAVPTIAHALKVPPLSMKAVLASYTLSLAVFIPISGWMANRFGTRRLFGGAIATFTLGSFLCGLASDIHWLVAFRILQGCGGAMMLPVGRLTTLHPLLRLGLLRIRTFRVAVTGNLCARLGIGGLPFLLPLLYQVGLGYTAIQSGLMIMPQAGNDPWHPSGPSRPGRADHPLDRGIQ